MIDIVQNPNNSSLAPCGIDNILLHDNSNIIPTRLTSSQTIPGITSKPVDNDGLVYSEFVEKEIDNEIESVISSISDLMKQYQMCNQSEDIQVCSGGLQQYLTRKLKRKNIFDNLQAQYTKNNSRVKLQFGECGMDTTSSTKSTPEFNNLPVNVKLYIFSYLSGRELCRVCSVNQEWCSLTNDDVLWRQRLHSDLPNWACISHTGNPQLYKEVQSDWTSKEIYLKCSPEVHKRYKEEKSTFHQVSQVLKYLLPKKVPKVAMFGPGMESQTRGIVRKMLYDGHESFKPVALFPGQFDGVGSGMTIQLPCSLTFNLSVLYTASKRERQQENRNRLVNNKLLQQQRDADGEHVAYELHPSIRDLCHTLDAFIFVVDASLSVEKIKEAQAELSAMVGERWSSQQVALLVLSCVNESTTPRLSANSIVEHLQLSQLNRPWLVQDVTVSSLSGALEGVQWLVEQSQHR